MSYQTFVVLAASITAVWAITVGIGIACETAVTYGASHNREGLARRAGTVGKWAERVQFTTWFVAMAGPLLTLPTLDQPVGIVAIGGILLTWYVLRPTAQHPEVKE